MTSNLPTWAFPRTRSTLYGALLPVQAAKLILSKPALIVWSSLPVALTLALYGFIIVRAQAWAKGLLHERFLAWGFSDQGWMFWGASALATVFLFFVSAFTFSAVSSIIASPFNDFLAEKTERWAEPALPAVPAMGWGAKVQLIFIDLGKTIAAGIATICALLLSWVPIVNFFAFGLAFLLVTFQYISYPQTRRGLGLGAGLRFLWRHLFACLGFGAALSVFFAVPLLGSLVLPLAVVGGTLLVARAQGQPGSFPLK